jgi:hypothetical protein
MNVSTVPHQMPRNAKSMESKSRAQGAAFAGTVLVSGFQSAMD